MTTTAPPDRPPGPRSGVPRWPATIALLLVAGLLALVSDQLTIGPSWLPLAVILVLFIPLTVASLRGRHDWRRRLAIIALGTVTAAVAVSAVLLVKQLVAGPVAAQSLLTGAGAIWAANLGTFALWYWEIDGGGPAERRRDGHTSTDFLFPQLQIGDGTSSGGWWPGFLDYLFVAFNASAAFSPTDTLILSRRAKVLMMIQSLISLVTVVVLAARAINTLR
jgi:Protein of unknown function (DUF1345).